MVDVDINDTILDAKKNMIRENEYFKHVNLDDLIIIKILSKILINQLKKSKI